MASVIDASSKRIGNHYNGAARMIYGAYSSQIEAAIEYFLLFKNIYRCYFWISWLCIDTKDKSFLIGWVVGTRFTAVCLLCE